MIFDLLKAKINNFTNFGWLTPENARMQGSHVVAQHLWLAGNLGILVRKFTQNV